MSIRGADIGGQGGLEHPHCSSYLYIPYTIYYALTGATSHNEPPHFRIAISTPVHGSRVCIAVSNCVDTMLVMWVFCSSGRVEDPVTWEYYYVNFIRFVVMGGLNLTELSHGLIGKSACTSPVIIDI